MKGDSFHFFFEVADAPCLDRSENNTITKEDCFPFRLPSPDPLPSPPSPNFSAPGSRNTALLDIYGSEGNTFSVIPPPYTCLRAFCVLVGFFIPHPDSTSFRHFLLTSESHSKPTLRPLSSAVASAQTRIPSRRATLQRRVAPTMKQKAL